MMSNGASYEYDVKYRLEKEVEIVNPHGDH